MFGHTEPGEPKVFSPAWWKFWNWFSGACADRGMGLGLDDYTVGWYGNGYYPDEVYNQPKYKNYQGKLDITAHPVAAGATLTLTLPEHTVSVVALPEHNQKEKPIDLTATTGAGKLTWTAPRPSPIPSMSRPRSPTTCCTPTTEKSWSRSISTVSNRT